MATSKPGAVVKPSEFGGGWVAYCKDCNESVSGHATGVDMWADIHNERNHKEARGE